MRLTIGQFRRIIREEIENAITEAPLADILPAADVRDDKSSPNRQIDRFHRTPLYKAKAANTFKEFPFPVYIVPVTVDQSISAAWERVHEMTPDEAFKFLESSGTQYDLEHLRRELASGAAIFLSMSTSTLTKGFLPTPWMIVHAFLDSQEQPVLRQEFENLFSLVYDDLGISVRSLALRMTTGSAREGKIVLDSDADPIAELMTQAIVDKRGVTFTWRGKREQPEEIAEMMEHLKSQIDAMNLKNKFYAGVQGKVFAIQTAIE